MLEDLILNKLTVSSWVSFRLPGRNVSTSSIERHSSAEAELPKAQKLLIIHFIFTFRVGLEVFLLFLS